MEDGETDAIAIDARPMHRRLVALPAGWPLGLLLGGYPLFWALGLSEFATSIMAIPMAVQLFRNRRILLPKGFGFWLLFLLWSLLGILVLGVNPRGTIPDSASSRLIAYAVREMSYFAVTIVVLYVGNLPVRRVPQSTIVRWLGYFFIATVAGGVLGMLAPTFNFTSPFEIILPDGIRSNSYVQHLVHPAAAQVQAVISDASARPAAPFAYTNAWGFHVTLLGVWFVAGWITKVKTGSRVVGSVILMIGFVTLIYSLNRGAWIGVGIAVLYIAVRLALRGKAIVLVSLALAVALGVSVFYASPLKSVVEARLDNGKSDNIRAFTTLKAFDLSSKSPVIGYGSTRTAYGSSASIAVGKTSSCPQCGNPPIGINGYIYMLLMSTGYVGAVLFFGLWAVQVWRARRVHSPTAIAGSLVLAMTSVYGFFYDAATWMLVPFVTVGLLWREVSQFDRDRADSTGGTH